MELERAYTKIEKEPAAWSMEEAHLMWHLTSKHVNCKDDAVDPRPEVHPSMLRYVLQKQIRSALLLKLDPLLNHSQNYLHKPMKSEGHRRGKFSKADVFHSS